METVSLSSLLSRSVVPLLTSVFSVMSVALVFLIRMMRELALVTGATLALYLMLLSGVASLAFLAASVAQHDGMNFLSSLACAMLCTLSYQAQSRLAKLCSRRGRRFFIPAFI